MQSEYIFENIFVQKSPQNPKKTIFAMIIEMQNAKVRVSELGSRSSDFVVFMFLEVIKWENDLCSKEYGLNFNPKRILTSGLKGFPVYSWQQRAKEMDRVKPLKYSFRWLYLNFFPCQNETLK